MTVIPLLVPGSPEHRQQRYVSASTAACLFGQHPFLDVGTLAAIKRGEVEDTAGEAAETGHVLEDVVAQWWADQHGVNVYKPEVTYTYGPLSSNPDRLIEGCADTVLQVKTTSHEEGTVKPYWWWQEQCEMACTGATQAIVAVLWGGSLTLREYVVGRDEEAICRLIDAAEQFLACLDLGIEPTVVGREPDAERLVEVGAEEATLCRDLLMSAELEASAKATRKTLRAQLDALVGGPGMVAGERLTLTHEGERLAKVSRRRGRVRQVPDPSGTRGDDYTVIEGCP